MRIDIVFPVLPPAIDGIADHTRLLAEALVEGGHDVRVLTAGVSSPSPQRAIRGVRVIDVWPGGSLHRSVKLLLQELVRSAPDAAVLQFEQFSYDMRGFNPGLAALFVRLARVRPDTVRVLFAHETYTTPDAPRLALMWAYQRPQFSALARSADVVLATTEAWLPRIRSRRAVVAVAPVFSNIPLRAGVGRALARVELGLDPAAPVAVWFGHIGARGPAFSATLAAVAAVEDAVLLYVGTDAATAERLAFASGARVQTADRPDAATVSMILQAADVAVAPFPDGVSTRRGSFLAGLQHGVPTVTTTGRDTDASLIRAARDGVFAAVPVGDLPALQDAVHFHLASPDRVEQISRIGAAATAFYEQRFAPARVAERLVALVSASPQRRARGDRNSSSIRSR